MIDRVFSSVRLAIVFLIAFVFIFVQLPSDDLQAAVSGIELDMSEVTIHAGDDVSLVATVYSSENTDAVSWSSSNSLIVKVDQGGRLTPRAFGTATITASAGGYSACCRVMVDYAQMTISQPSLSMEKGDSTILYITPPDGYQSSAVVWRTSDSSIASVSGSGPAVTIVGNDVGQSTIQAIYGNLFKATCSVTVSERPDTVDVYSFYLKMDMDFEEAETGFSGLTIEELKEGFTIVGEGTNAGEALEDALNREGIPCEFFSGSDSAGVEILYWVKQIFGMEQFYLPNGDWKYWIQYHKEDGNYIYNDWTLGYYTGGGDFMIVYGITKDPSTTVAVPIPSPVVGLKYNGVQQTGVSSGTGYTIFGNVATDAGTYIATLILDDGYSWPDGTVSERSISWTISEAVLTAKYLDETVSELESPSFQVDVSGFVNGESPSTIAGYVAPSVSGYVASIGEQILVPSGGSARNYVFEYVPGTLVIGSGVSVGDAFVSSGLVYTVTSVDPLEVSLTGYDAAPATLRVPETVTNGAREFDVVSIGEKAFYGCTALTSADLGGVSKVGVKAFAQCTRLRSVHAGDSLSTISAYAFCKCTRLVDFDLEDSLKAMRTIGSYAFYKDLKLGSFAVSSFVSTIGKSAFSLPFEDGSGAALAADAGLLAGYVYLNAGGTLVRQPGPVVGAELSWNGLRLTVTASLPAEAGISGYTGKPTCVSLSGPVAAGGSEYDVTSVMDGAFRSCKTLVSVSLPGVEEIGKESFYGCSKLVSVSIPDAKSVGVKAFARCSHLSELDIGGPLRTVSAYAFFGCSALASFDGGGSLKTVGSYAFSGCSSLRDVSLGPALATIGAKAFASCPIESVDLSPVLKTVKDQAFAGLEFRDSGGSVLAHTAAALRGHAFSGSGGVLVAEQ